MAKTKEKRRVGGAYLNISAMCRENGESERRAACCTALTGTQADHPAGCGSLNQRSAIVREQSLTYFMINTN